MHAWLKVARAIRAAREKAKEINRRKRRGRALKYYSGLYGRPKALRMACLMSAKQRGEFKWRQTDLDRYFRLCKGDNMGFVEETEASD